MEIKAFKFFLFTYFPVVHEVFDFLAKSIYITYLITGFKLHGFYFTKSLTRVFLNWGANESLRNFSNEMESLVLFAPVFIIPSTEETD